MKYSENGFWIQKEEKGYRIGLSAKGQDDLGDVGFLEILGDKDLSPDASMIGVEASKAVTELTAPLQARVIKWHEELEKEPELLNSTDPKDNWIVLVDGVDESAYEALLDSDGLSA